MLDRQQGSPAVVTATPKNMDGWNVSVSMSAPNSPGGMSAMSRSSGAHLEPFHDEDFSLNPHYTLQLEECLAKGSQAIQWANGFTLLHYAAKKNDRALLDFLLNPKNKCGFDIHAIDDFGKKAVDYSNAKKRDSLHDHLQTEMQKSSPLPQNAKKEEDYQKVQEMIAKGEIKPNRPSLNLNEIEESQMKKSGKKPPSNFDSSLSASAGFKLPDNIAGGQDQFVVQTISQYEVEQQIPAEYKKLLKKASGGWENCKTSWPNGETLLHWAARHDKEEVVKFCIFTLGADIHEEDPTGKDALAHAKLKKHRKLYKDMLAGFRPQGADILRNSAGEIIGN